MRGRGSGRCGMWVLERHVRHGGWELIGRSMRLGRRRSQSLSRWVFRVLLHKCRSEEMRLWSRKTAGRASDVLRTSIEGCLRDVKRVHMEHLGLAGISFTSFIPLTCRTWTASSSPSKQLNTSAVRAFPAYYVVVTDIQHKTSAHFIPSSRAQSVSPLSSPYQRGLLYVSY